MSCKASHNPTARAELKIDGKEIELNNFVENFISKTVIGMVKSLRGVCDADTISLKISRRAQ